MSKMPITPGGFEKLSKELDHLVAVVRPKTIQDIAEARAHGDISENAEYDAAKERQGMVEARIRYLQSKIQLFEVIDPATIKGETVKFGATVSIIDCETEKSETWQIVGEDEAELKLRKISITSPLAKALIGKKVGDEVEILTPGGKKECEIVSLKYV